MRPEVLPALASVLLDFRRGGDWLYEHRVRGPSEGEAMCLAKWERKHLVRRAVLSEWIVLAVMWIGFAPWFGSWWLRCFGVAPIACVVGWKSRSAAFLRRTLCDPDSVRTCLPLARGTSDGSLHATVMAL